MVGMETPSIASETIAHIGSFEIRNTMLMAWMAMLILIAISLLLRGTGYKQIPGRFQAFMELIVEGLFNFFDSILQNPLQTRKLFPLVATILIFIAVANWIGILPGVGSIVVTAEEGHHAVPLLRSMNADVNMTLAIAAISFVCTQFLGLFMLGLREYSSKFLIPPWRNPLGTFIGILELTAEFTRVISFTFRLFGNIFAGEVLLIVVGFLVPYIAPVPFLGLEIFVGFIQALVFAMLTLVFIKIAMTPHGDHSSEPAHA